MTHADAIGPTAMSRTILDIFGIVTLASLVDFFLFDGNAVSLISRMVAEIALYF